MNTQQLESFVQVAENLSFARAAEALNITQSAVSRQIRALEEELGTKLLLRSTRAVALTPAGMSFLNDAKEILMKLELSTQKLKNHSSTSMQFLTIGCIHETYLPLLTPLLSRCREEFPMIHPFFRMIPFRAAYQLFIHNEIDILFGFQEDLSMPEGFTYQEIRSLSICFVMREDHPLANEELLTEEDILSERLVLCNSFDIPARVASLQTQLTHRFSPDQTNYCENVPAMLTLIRSGYGIGILPKIPESEKQITCVPITDTSSLSYGVFYRNHPENPLTNDFLSLLDV